MVEGGNGTTDGEPGIEAYSASDPSDIESYCSANSNDSSSCTGKELEVCFLKYQCTTGKILLVSSSQSAELPAS